MNASDDLHTGTHPHPGGDSTSIWHGTADVPTFPALTRSGSTDVVVVGAGIAGLSVAYHLARGGKKVVVLDDGPIGGGETGRTTAHLTYAMDDRIYSLEAAHGAEGARLAVESHAAAINRFQQIAQLEDIDCDFARIDGYLMSRTPGQTGELEREFEAAHRAGLTDLVLVDRAPIPGFETGTALRFPGQGRLHPMKFLAGLANAIVHKYGGQIHCNTHVEGVEGGNPCNVRIAGGMQLSASCVAVCTNASISDYVQTHAKMAPYRTYAIALAVPRGSVDNALYWETGHPYHYVRIQPLSDGQYQGEPVAPTKGEVLWDALIVGGEDHRTGQDSHPEERWKKLEQWTRTRWPQAREVIYRWSGQVMEPNDWLAYIGRNPDGAEGVFMASGDSGQGMTHGMIAGILLSDLMLGKPNAWETLYDPKRVSLRAAPIAEAVMHNADVMYEYAKGYLKPDIRSADDIRPGEGAVIRRGLKKIAVYRNEQGHLIEKSAVCTHLKCIVEWNGAEKTWDCPCHGSRFAPNGEVLNGPAMSALEDVEPARAEPTRARKVRTE
jgi:glycine/D-amino acid oxidase-like deaminating enzyme/nitrite reductase/ring-hydroxylating ferredoxin subunit